MPLLRYVDDLFGILIGDHPEDDRAILLEIVDLLGLKLDPLKTPSPSSSMTILGVLVTIVAVAHVTFAQLDIDPRKQAVWLRTIDGAISRLRLSPSEAESLAGRLEFAASAVLGKGHRHRLMTVYEHSYRHDSNIASQEALLDDLRWWSQLLSSTVHHRRVQLNGSRSPPMLLYTDAEGSGGLGAVLFSHQQSSPHSWLFGHAPQDIVARFQSRRTQIVPLEALAVIAAVITWTHLLRGQRVIIMVDNVSVVGALRKGSSRKRDINLIIGAIHMHALAHDIDLFVHWVPSRYNIADLPSRGRPPSVQGGESSALCWQSVSSSIY
jgi:ribonuclease HI/cell division protein ZapA (FtsZ GTPase activity inhibitor)